MKNIKLMLLLTLSSALFASEQGKQESFLVSSGSAVTDPVRQVTWNPNGVIEHSNVQFIQFPWTPSNEVVATKVTSNGGVVKQLTFNQQGMVEFHGVVLQKITGTDFSCQSPLFKTDKANDASLEKTVDVASALYATGKYRPSAEAE